MKKNIFLIIFISLILIIVATVLIKNQTQNLVCFQKHCFKVELAKTDEERDRGLMFRKTLNSNKGMLFIYEKEEIYSFWMKNTLIPLDIIWINQNKEVVFISGNSQPCENNYPCPFINPYKNAKYVLEINGGIAEKFGLEIGDKMILNIK